MSNETEPQFADGLITTTEIRLGWLARLRVLVHGELSVWSHVETEHAIGRTRTRETRTTVRPILPQRQQYGEAKA